MVLIGFDVKSVASPVGNFISSIVVEVWGKLVEEGINSLSVSELILKLLEFHWTSSLNVSLEGLDDLDIS